MIKHVMLDLETWGTSPYSLIVMIGACRFDPYAKADNLVVQEQFEVAIDLTHAQGFRIDPHTMLWWMDPEREPARRIWLKRDKVSLPVALDGFADWLRDQSSDGVCDDLRIWGNGSDFDNAILRQAYEVMKRDVPWNFRYNRCFRTLRNLLDLGGPDDILHPAFSAMPASAHTALADAENQARRVAQIVRKLGIQLT
jgi:hypothetical protein